MFQIRLKGVSSNLKGVSRVSKRSLKHVSGKLHWSFKGVSRKFQASRAFEESFKGALSFKWASRVFKRSSVGVSKFQRCFKDVSRNF